jgi:hypothetical protein
VWDDLVFGLDLFVCGAVSQPEYNLAILWNKSTKT